MSIPRRHTFGADVEVPLPPEVVFRYLADPRNRPEWQSSLMSVTIPERFDEPYVGLAWTDTTVVGVRPRMEITELVPYRTWAEVGHWHGVAAGLLLRFTAVPRGTRVRAEGWLAGRGPWAVAAAATARAAGLGVRGDLARAARILTERYSPR